MNKALSFAQNATGIQHLGIPTGDLEATIAFYQSLGFELSWRTADDSADKVAFLKLHNLVIETYLVDAPALKNGAIDHVAIDVADIDAAWRDAQACGYETEDTQVNFLPFFERGVKFFTILGPNREKVEFNQKL